MNLALAVRRPLMRFLVAVLAVVPLASSAQSAPEVEALRKDVEALRREVGEVRKLLEQMRQPPPRADAALTGPVKVRIGGAGVALGRPDAPVTIVEFSDYQCPFCARYASQTFPELKRDYIDTGRVRYVLRDFPLDNIHPDARKAAESAHCAGDQGKYWEMHEALFRNIRLLAPEHLRQRAKALGLDEAAFGECLDKGRYAATVNENFTAGRALGVTATPTFFVGRTTRDGTMEATQVRGAQPTANFRKAIDALLESKPAS